MGKTIAVKEKNKGLPKTVGILLGVGAALIFLTIIILHHNPLAVPKEEWIKKAIAIAMVVVALIAYIGLYDKIIVLPGELWSNRELIWKLAKNDFKKRYAGSTMGRVWAFVQPVVTVLMYYCVFGLIFPARAQLAASGIEAPYVLWLTAGLVPWFYFSEDIGVSGKKSRFQNQYSADYQGYCGHVHSCIFRVCNADSVFYLRLQTEHLFNPACILQFLYVFLMSGHQLFNLCHRGLL